jgi:hypothetical protein
MGRFLRRAPALEGTDEVFTHSSWWRTGATLGLQSLPCGSVLTKDSPPRGCSRAAGVVGSWSASDRPWAASGLGEGGGLCPRTPALATFRLVVSADADEEADESAGVVFVNGDAVQRSAFSRTCTMSYSRSRTLSR